MLYTLRPANFCITFRADYGRAYDRIAWRENWGLVNRPAGMAAGGFIKRFAGAVALHHCTGYSSCYPCCLPSKRSLFRQFLMHWRFASYSFRCLQRRFWCPISSGRRALRRPSLTRNNLTVNLLWPVVVYPIIGGSFISG